MRLSFSTATYILRSLDYNLRMARDLGYDGVELVIGPEALVAGAAALRRVVERVGLPALSVHPPFTPLPGWPRYNIYSVPQTMALARDLGAEVGVIHAISFYRPDATRNAYFSEALRRGRAAGGNVAALTIESSQYNPQAPLGYLDHIRRLVNYARTRGCGLTFDTCHAGACHEDILLDYELVRPLLRNVHLNDLVWRGDRARTHLAPGDGELPLRELMRRLARNGYDGLVTVELHPREVALAGRGATERTLARALAFMRAAIAEGKAEAAAPAAANEAAAPREELA